MFQVLSRFKIVNFIRQGLLPRFGSTSSLRITVTPMFIPTELCVHRLSSSTSSDLNRRTGSELTVRLPRFDSDDYERFAPVHVHLVTNCLIIADCFHRADASHALRIAADTLIAIILNTRERERTGNWRSLPKP